MGVRPARAGTAAAPAGPAPHAQLAPRHGCRTLDCLLLVSRGGGALRQQGDRKPRHARPDVRPCTCPGAGVSLTLPYGRGPAGAGTPSGTASASASLYSFDLGPDADDIPPSAALAGGAPALGALGGGPLGGGSEADGGGQGIALVVDAQARAPPCASRAGRCLNLNLSLKGLQHARVSCQPHPRALGGYMLWKLATRLPVPRATSFARPGGSRPWTMCS